MRNRIWILCCGLTLALAAAALADPPPPPMDPPDPPGTTPYMDQLRAQFTAWDLNKDDSLDKEELAKAFRGADAKPYDYKKPTDADKAPPADPPKDPAAAKKPDAAEYPDYGFLLKADQDGDGQISRVEYMSWARDYAVQLKQQSDQAAKVLALQAKMQAATSAKDVKALQKELAKEQAAANKVNSQMTKEMKALEKAMQQHLKHK